MTYTPPPPRPEKEQLQQLIYRISHDFSAPLRHIKEFTRLILSEMPSALNEKQMLYKEYLDKSVADFNDKLNGLLALSRIETHANDFHSMSVNTCLQILLEHNHNYFSHSNDTITLNCQANCHIQADQPQLIQAFQHIVDNAIKFKQPQIPLILNIHLRAIGDNVMVSLIDNGMGMHPDHLHYIFDLFNQLNPHQTEGAGVGLTLANNIIQRHQGTVSIDSSLNSGTSITVTFKALKQ